MWKGPLQEISANAIFAYNIQVMFDAVGGLNKQIRALKEMVLFPLMYPEVFEKFKISPPRGVLFHGPPGTVYDLNLVGNSID